MSSLNTDPNGGTGSPDPTVRRLAEMPQPIHNKSRPTPCRVPLPKTKHSMWSSGC